ncbi:hypothetical protein Tco_0980785 [Tanacetum coccineum]
MDKWDTPTMYDNVCIVEFSYAKRGVTVVLWYEGGGVSCTEIGPEVVEMREAPKNDLRREECVLVARLVLLGEKGKLLLSPQHIVIGNTNDITGTKSPNTMVDQDYPQRALQNKGIVDSGCSRHMTRNKAYLAKYQDFNGDHVAFRGRDRL